MPDESGCKLHESRIDQLDADIAKHNGWLKTAGLVCSIAIMVLGWMGTHIVSKLDSISALLTDGKVVQMQHSEQIRRLMDDVKEIQTWHQQHDQSVLRGGK